MWAIYNRAFVCPWATLRCLAFACYIPANGDHTQVLIWAPKSLFKHAVDRNHLRRLIREAYRLNKGILEENNLHYQLAFNYIDKQVQSYSVIEKAMRKALKRLLTNNQNS